MKLKIISKIYKTIDYGCQHNARKFKASGFQEKVVEELYLQIFFIGN